MKDKEIAERAYLVRWLWKYPCYYHLEVKHDSLAVLSQNEAMTSVHGGAPEKAHD